MTFIIANNQIVAKVKTTVAPGTTVRYSTQRTAEAIDAAREWNLVNASTGKISDAAKWHRQWDAMCAEEQGDHGTGEEINPGEFYIA